MSDEYIALTSRLEQSMLDLENVVSRTEKQMQQAFAISSIF